MIRLRHKLLVRFFRVLDQVLLAGIVYTIFRLRPDSVFLTSMASEVLKEASIKGADFLAICVLGIGWVMIYSRMVRYTGERFTILKKQLRSVAIAASVASAWLLLVAVFFDVRSFTKTNVVIFWVCAVFIGMLSRLLMVKLVTKARQSGLNYRYLLVVGGNEHSLNLVNKIKQHHVLGYRVVGYLAENAEQREEFQQRELGEEKVIGLMTDLEEVLKVEPVDEIVVCLSLEGRFSDVAHVLRCAKELGVVCRIAPSEGEGDFLSNLHVETFEGTQLLTFFREQLLVHLLAKRMMDCCFSLAGLICLAPFLAIVAAIIKLSDGGPVFFAQERVGMNKRRFKMWKFRTMVPDADLLKETLMDQNQRSGPAFKMANDPRITRVGRFLRKFSIDELPQLWNVFKGEMSLVGPRPPIPKEVDDYDWFSRKRLSVKPGITCLWQVSGRDNIEFEEWMELDAHYIDNWSVWMDLSILLRTIPAVVSSKGAS